MERQSDSESNVFTTTGASTSEIDAKEKENCAAESI
jgi:hypothetical protein